MIVHRYDDDPLVIDLPLMVALTWMDWRLNAVRAIGDFLRCA